MFRKRFLSGEQFSPAELSYKNASFFYEFASLLQRCFARATFLLQANKFDSVSGSISVLIYTLTNEKVTALPKQRVFSQNLKGSVYESD